MRSLSAGWKCLGCKQEFTVVSHFDVGRQVRVNGGWIDPLIRDGAPYVAQVETERVRAVQAHACVAPMTVLGLIWEDS
jgi:hypothetical protein